MTKLLIGLLSLALVGTGGLIAAVGGFGGVDPASAVSFTTPTDETQTAATTTEGTTTGLTTAATSTAATDDGVAADISGPCDEAEHANDPRCSGATGVATDADQHYDRQDGDRGDRSEGPSSGSRGDDDEAYSSGHGSGGDEADSSGHGSGDDDNSGHGSDDD